MNCTVKKLQTIYLNNTLKAEKKYKTIGIEYRQFIYSNLINAVVYTLYLSLRRQNQ